MLAKTIVNRPISIFIIFSVFISLSFVTINSLALDLLPDIDIPVVIISTSYGETAPEEVEQSVTRLIEGAMGSISNLDKISSTSSKGSSKVVLEFIYGTNIDSSVNSIRDALDRVKAQLPDDADAPSIFQVDPNSSPILELVLSGEGRSPEDLLTLAEDYIQPQVERIEGVATTSISGAREEIIKVTVKQNRLDAYDITLTDITNILSNQNRQVSGGTLTEGSMDYTVLTSGEFNSIEDIKNTVIAYKSDVSGVSSFSGEDLTHTIRLRDIADVKRDYEKEESLVYFNDNPALSISVFKQSGSNTVQVVDKVLDSIESLNYLFPPGVELKPVSDTSVYIRNSLAEVVNSGLTGAILAVIILFIFLRSVRSTLIVFISIPVSILITLMGMSFLGLTLNIMTLTGLALGMGLLIDNSIVILENIYQYKEKGLKLKPSGILGTQEMLSAILAATLTTVFVFVPVILFRKRLEVIGEILGGLAFTVVVSILASLVVAVFLVPVLCTHFLPLVTRKDKPLKGVLAKMDNATALFFARLDIAYKNSISWVLYHKKRVIFVILLLFFGSLTLVSHLGFNLMPSSSDDSVTVTISLPIGSNIELTRSVLFQIEDMVKNEIEGYSDIAISVGTGGGFSSTGSHKGTLTITLPEFDERIDDFNTIQDKLREQMKNLPADVSYSFGSGRTGGISTPIDVVISSNDLTLLDETALSVKNLLETDFKDYVTEVESDLPDPLPQINIEVDRGRLYDLGLNVYTIGNEVKASLEGLTTLTKYRIAGRENEIKVSLSDRDKEQALDLGKIFVINSRGEKIILDSVAKTVVTTGPTEINRENQSRTVHVTAQLLPGADLKTTTALIQEALTEKVPSSSSLSVQLSGEYEDTMKQFGNFALILVVAILLIYGTMAAQFESFLDPFLILFTIPLTFTGVILVYFLTGKTVTVFSAVGIVMLAGIAVNNGIILIEYIRLLIARGYDIRDAIVESARSRLRPILMTNLTTILGLLPLAFTSGDSGSLVEPIGLTILGGLSTSAILTLFLIPALFHIFHFSIPRRIEIVKNFFRKKKA